MTNKNLKLAAMSVALTACVAAQPLVAHAVDARGWAATQAVSATDMAASFSFLFVMIDGSFQMVSSLLRITTVLYDGHISRLAILLPLYHFLVQVVKKKYVETHDL